MASHLLDTSVIINALNRERGRRDLRFTIAASVRDCGRDGATPRQRAVPVPYGAVVAGRMFWFTRNRFSGS